MNSKTRNIALVSGFVLACVICYVFAFSKTFDARTSFKDLEKQEALFEDIPKQFSLLNQKMQYYDSLLNRYQLTETSIQNNLLKTINRKATELDIKVVQFNEPHVYSMGERSKNTYGFTLEGDFANLISVLHHLEQNTKYGEVLTMRFVKEKNHRKGTYYLQLSVLLQNRN
ncbi:hypothetical protein [Ascidiimonas aurantiaca]|uniref:hypothetical protein n=1 Tax=Ascidiimonas aurantiaca TaxID=1685432 RepID=UPI0030EE437F